MYLRYFCYLKPFAFGIFPVVSLAPLISLILTWKWHQPALFPTEKPSVSLLCIYIIYLWNEFVDSTSEIILSLKSSQQSWFFSSWHYQKGFSHWKTTEVFFWFCVRRPLKHTLKNTGRIVIHKGGWAITDCVCLSCSMSVSVYVCYPYFYLFRQTFQPLGSLTSYWVCRHRHFSIMSRWSLSTSVIVSRWNK